MAAAPSSAAAAAEKAILSAAALMFAVDEQQPVVAVAVDGELIADVAEAWMVWFVEWMAADSAEYQVEKMTASLKAASQMLFA